MVRNCCVKFCKRVWQPNSNLTFFRFPVKNEVVASRWRETVPCKGTLGKSSCVCSDHFTQEDFIYIGPRRCLKKHAVPSIFPVESQLLFLKLFPTTCFTTSALQAKLQCNEAQAAMLRVDRGQACSTVYETRHNAAPDVPLFQSEAPENQQDHQPDAVPEPSQPRNLETSKFQSDIKVEEVVETQEDSVGADTAMVLSDLTEDNFSKKNYTQYEQNKMATALENERKKVAALTRKVRILQARLRRREAKLRNVTTLLKLLKRKGKCTDDLEHVLLRRFGGFNLELFQNELKNNACPKSGKRYTEKMKEFASTIYFYSPKAYKYLRTKLNLPNEWTLRKMIGETKIQTGFVGGVFQFLKDEVLKSDSF